MRLKGRVDVRFHATTLDFARDLCEVIRDGVNTEPMSAVTNGGLLEETNGSTMDHFGDARERRRLGKRILKAVQPQLEAALQTETMINSKSLEELTKGLDAMMEACVELQQPSITVSQEHMGGGEDTVMADAPALQITVANQDQTTGQGAGPDTPDVMDTSLDGGVPQVDSTTEDDGADTHQGKNGIAVSAPTPESQKNPSKPTGAPGTDQDSNTPPATNGYVAVPKPAQATPPTPPQSTDSLSHHHHAAPDPLTDGGVPWYLGPFDLSGTSAGEPAESEGGNGGSERGRSPSEELTDMDDAELKELANDVEKDTITASGGGAGRRVKREVEVGVGVVRATRSSARRR